jgi:hypothetical protein
MGERMARVAPRTRAGSPVRLTMNEQKTFHPTSSDVPERDPYKMLSLTEDEFLKLKNVGHPGGAVSVSQNDARDSNQAHYE